MTDANDEPAVSRVVDGWLHPSGNSFILRFNPPDGGATQHVAFPVEDVPVLADIAALSLRRRLAAVDPEQESALATSFDLAEIPGADTIVVSFSRGSQPPSRVALPKALATRLMKSFEKLLPLIGGRRSVN